MPSETIKIILIGSKGLHNNLAAKLNYKAANIYLSRLSLLIRAQSRPNAEAASCVSKRRCRRRN